MAKPTPASVERLLVTELWGIGDLALAMPFLQTASRHAKVTLLAKPHAAPLLQRFAPEVDLVAFDAPWTVFEGKYRLHQWRWHELRKTLQRLREHQFAHAVSARPDPREHAFLKLAGAANLIGFPRIGSGLLLTERLPSPDDKHRAAHWQALAAQLGWKLRAPLDRTSSGRHIVIHTGAAQAVRRWPLDRYTLIAERLRVEGWQVSVIDEAQGNLAKLLDTLTHADRFIGNDSGPGHLAALVGVPTFTIFSSQLPEKFSPQHPRSAWLEGAPCRFKPCSDYCRFPQPHCLLDVSAEEVWSRLRSWLVIS